MNPARLPKRRLIALSSYALVALAVLLYLRFPGEELRSYAEARLAAMVPGSTCHLTGLSYRFPRTLEIASLQFSPPVKEGWGVEARDLAVTVRSFLPSYQLAVSGAFLHGRFAGMVVVDAGAKIVVQGLQLRDLDLAALPEQLLGGRQLAGLLNVDGEVRLSVAGNGTATGQGRLDVRDGSAALRQPVLSLRQLRFSRISCEWRLAGGSLEISDGILQGADLSAEFSGGWQGEAQTAGSEVQLNGRLRPEAALLAASDEQARALELLLQQQPGGVGFQVEGTAASPVFRLVP